MRMEILEEELEQLFRPGVRQCHAQEVDQEVDHAFDLLLHGYKGHDVRSLVVEIPL